jgi:hypothetical protein
MTRIAVSTVAILLTTSAFAQMPPPPLPGAPPPVWQQAMTISGTVTRFTLTPRGDLDGLILRDGTQVHVPPHLSDQLAAAVRSGNFVTVVGYRSPSGALFAATSVTNTTSNQTVIDRGPPAPGLASPPPPPGMPAPGAQNSFAQGRVERLLRGPAGDVNGAILDDGTILRMPPHIAYQFASVLIPAQSVAAQGWGLTTPYGRVVDVQSIGASTAQVSPATQPGAALLPMPGALTPPRP